MPAPRLHIECTIGWLNRCRRLAKDRVRLNRNGLALLRRTSAKNVSNPVPEQQMLLDRLSGRTVRLAPETDCARHLLANKITQNTMIGRILASTAPRERSKQWRPLSGFPLTDRDQALVQTASSGAYSNDILGQVQSFTTHQSRNEIKFAPEPVRSPWLLHRLDQRPGARRPHQCNDGGRLHRCHDR